MSEEELNSTLHLNSNSNSNSSFRTLFSVPYGTILSEQNTILMPTLTDMGNTNSTTTTTFSTTNSAEEEYTQIVSIFGFSALVLIAIFAWLFSRHCCFLEKPPGPGDIRRPRPQQFNFLGAQVIRRLGSNSVASVRTEEPPPAYDDLFPTAVVVIVPDTNISTPAPAHDEPDPGNKTNLNEVNIGKATNI